MDRLETLAADLHRKLCEASPARQRAAAVAASQFALETAGVRHVSVGKAHHSLSNGRNLSPEQQTDLEKLVSDLDTEYFDLLDAADEVPANAHSSLQKFAQARAISALLFAFEDDPWKAAAEAVYEAAAAFEDKGPLFAVVELALRMLRC